MDKGWIKLNRQIQEHWIWNDPEKLKAWIDLLLLANHETKKVEMRDGLVSIKRGQFVTSIDKLSKRWGWSKNRVYRFLSLLESDNMIQRNANRYRTTVSIVNYSKFQDKQNTNGTTNGSPNESTDGSPSGSRTRKNKNDKEIKEKAPLDSDESASPKKEKRVEVIPGYTQEELDENFLDGFIPMTDEEWESLPET